MLNSICKITGVASLVLTFAATATAQLPGAGPAEDSFYVSAFVGAAFPDDAELDGLQDPDVGSPGVAGAPANVVANLDTDVFFGGAIGYQAPFQFFGVIHPRAEIEVSYFEADVSGGAFNGGNQVFSGEQGVLFVLLNQYADFKFSDDQLIVPYLGGGLGLGIVDNNIQYFPDNGIATAPTFGVVEDDTAFATHTAIGLTFKATERLEVYTEGRYYRIYNVESERRFIADGADIFNAEVDGDIDGFTATAGARFRF
ncbi:MAG: hypothetical protein AAGJ29_05950 [Pseudomonadota bacterium]